MGHSLAFGRVVRSLLPAAAASSNLFQSGSLARSRESHDPRLEQSPLSASLAWQLAAADGEAKPVSETVDGRPYGHHDASRPPAKLPHPPAGEPNEGGDDIDPTRQAGLHAIEMYVPRHSVKAKELERAHGVDGKYTQGLMMTEFCGTGEDEDPVSIALTVVSRLMYRYNINFEEVGLIYVGSESLIDRCKSIKSNLMMLWNEHNCFDVDGCDCYNACYGGTAALLNTMNWITSQSWDGRWALAVATDIADSPEGYRFMTGCASAAMLVGVDAAMVFERERVRGPLAQRPTPPPIREHRAQHATALALTGQPAPRSPAPPAAAAAPPSRSARTSSTGGTFTSRGGGT